MNITKTIKKFALCAAFTAVPAGLVIGDCWDLTVGSLCGGQSTTLSWYNDPSCSVTTYSPYADSLSCNNMHESDEGGSTDCALNYTPVTRSRILYSPAPLYQCSDSEINHSSEVIGYCEQDYIPNSANSCPSPYQ